MKTRTPRSLRLVDVPPPTRAAAAALARRVAAAKTRHGGPTTDSDIPEDVPAGATITHGPARRGRPRLTEEGSQPVTLRMPRRLISYFKRGGRGWQTRVISALTKIAESGK